MAEPATAGNEQQLKQRAMRRLALALALIVAAIVGLGLLDHYSGRKRAVVAEAPSSEPPAIATLPEPKPLEPEAPQAQAPAAQPAPALPPPPPPAVEERPSMPLAAQPSNGAQVPESVGGHAPSRGASTPAAEPHKPHASGSAAAPVPATASSPEARQGFVVQLGVFTTVENAQSLQAKLKQQGIPAFLETRVVVGPLRDRAEADSVQQKLKAFGVGGVIVQRK